MLSTGLAFATTATLVSFFPSKKYRSSDKQPSPGNNGGNGGGRAAHASALYLVDPPRNSEEATVQQGREERETIREKQHNEVPSPTIPLLHDRRRVYDVSFIEYLIKFLDLLPP